MAFRQFHHPADVIAFPNETLWSYSQDPATGKQVIERKDPPPNFTLRCFGLCRAVQAFHLHATFEPEAAPLAPEETAAKAKAVLRRDFRSPAGPEGRIVISGYADLRSFSVKHEALLKKEVGRAWRSYFQRSHWRMIFPFSKKGQENEAQSIVRTVQDLGVSTLHVFTFPALAINHALVVFSAVDSKSRIDFQAYDPNEPGRALEFWFDRSARVFRLPPTSYFVGGDVNVFQIYCGLFR